MKRLSFFCGLIALGLALLFIDFFSKSYVLNMLAGYDILVFRDLFGVDCYISLAFNKGAAWGLFASLQSWLLLFRIALIAGMILYLFFFNRRRSYAYPFVLIIAGAIGNVVDFFLYGHVIDFISMNLWGYRFPIFNIADSAITIGVAWLFALSMFTRKKRYERV